MKTRTAPNPCGNMKEGDTPSWFYFLLNGLNAPDHPEYGGWGGRFQKSAEGYYTDATDWNDTTARATVWFWREEFQNHFAARIDWCVNSYEEANHAPEIRIDGRQNDMPLILEVKRGETVRFDLSESNDPDGDDISWDRLIYDEISNFNNETKRIELTNEILTITMDDLVQKSRNTSYLKSH